MLIKVNRFEILYNKCNKDLILLIVFEDVIKIVDKIILKIDLEKDPVDENNINKENLSQVKSDYCNESVNTLNKIKNQTLQNGDLSLTHVEKININKNNSKKKKKSSDKNEKSTILNTGLLKFYFSLRNPKIHLENEISGSHIILVSEEECSVELSDICLDTAKKDFILNINLKKINLLSQKTDKNTYKILESPEIYFKIQNTLESKLDKIESYNEISINVAKIRGFFLKKDFEDFNKILEIVLLDRTESYAIEKKKNGDKIDVLRGNKKLSDIKAIIERKTSSWESQMDNNTKIKKKLKFNVSEVDLALKKVKKYLKNNTIFLIFFKFIKEDETKLQLIITQFYGEHIIWDRIDKKSRSKVYLGDVKLISNIDDKNQNRYLLRKLETRRNLATNLQEIHSIPIMNLQPLISLDKSDKYILLEKEDLDVGKIKF